MIFNWVAKYRRHFWCSYRLLAYSYRSLIFCLRPKLALYPYAYGSLVYFRLKYSLLVIKVGIFAPQGCRLPLFVIF